MDELDMDRTAGDPGDAVFRFPRRRGREAPVELAVAAAVRPAADRLLAGARALGAEPDPLRWLRMAWAWFCALPNPPAHRRALRVHDPRGAGTIPAAHPGEVGLRPLDGREPGAMNPGRRVDHS